MRLFFNEFSGIFTSYGTLLKIILYLFNWTNFISFNEHPDLASAPFDMINSALSEPLLRSGPCNNITNFIKDNKFK